MNFKSFSIFFNLNLSLYSNLIKELFCLVFNNFCIFHNISFTYLPAGGLFYLFLPFFNFLRCGDNDPAPTKRYCWSIPKTVNVFQYKESPIGRVYEKNPIITGKINKDCFWKAAWKSSD